MRDDFERIRDILDSIAHIDKYSAQGYSTFVQSELIQTWIIHHILIIGEAVSRLSEEIRNRHPEIPWRQMITMRNILVHVYFKVGKDEVWNVVESDLPKLKQQLSDILIQEF
jgi:uncharacterized protein with HEPN domain